MEGTLINDELRKITSRITKSEPATWSNHITHYIKEAHESHRFRHVNFDSADDHHIYHGLPYDIKTKDLKLKYNIKPNDMNTSKKVDFEELKRLVKESNK